MYTEKIVICRNDNLPARHIVFSQYFAAKNIEILRVGINKCYEVFFLPQTIFQFYVVSVPNYRPIANIDMADKLLPAICNDDFSIVK